MSRKIASQFKKVACFGLFGLIIIKKGRGADHILTSHEVARENGRLNCLVPGAILTSKYITLLPAVDSVPAGLIVLR